MLDYSWLVFVLFAIVLLARIIMRISVVFSEVPFRLFPATGHGSDHSVKYAAQARGAVSGTPEPLFRGRCESTTEMQTNLN